MFLFLFTACKNEKEQTREIPETVTPIDHEQAVHPENLGDLVDIRLDDGKAWKIKSELSGGIDRMSETISKHSPQSAEDYRVLSEKLQEEKTELEKDLETDAEYHSNLEIFLTLSGQK